MASKIHFWRPWILALFISITPGLFTTDATAQSSNSFWQAQSIYQIITDRFYDGNTTNDNVEGTYAPSNPTGVHGGDFGGLEQKLDYIKSLGATAIWISPIVLNTEGQYHGYSAWNFYEVAPHWGSITDLQNVVQAAHARGLKVIDDIVLNHGGDLVTGSGSGWPNYNYPAGYTLSYVNSSKTYPAPFNLTSANPALADLWHNYGDIDSYNNTQEVVLGWLDGLNDLKTETPYVRTNLIDIYEYWINQIGFDAFRVDSVLEVDHGCWQTFCPAIYAYTATNIPYGATNANTNFFMFGEVDNGSESVVGPYTGTEDGGSYEFESTEDYPLYYDLNNVFATLSGAPGEIQNHYNDVQADYNPTTWAQQVIFLDNQDNPRFLSTSESSDNTNALKVALAFLYTSVGIPCLYYGTEQGFDGTTDPDCREDMFAGEWKDGPNGTVVSLSSPGVDNFNMTHPLFQWVARLNNFRRLYPAMSLGSYTNQWDDSSAPGLFAYSRILNTQEVFVVFNTAGSSQTLPARTLTYPTGTVLVNLLNTNETYTLTTGSQTPAITVPSVTAKIFIAQSQWQALDPVVAGNSPGHWTTNVPSYTPIVLQFSDSMNTNSVQAAFTTVPAVSGSFSWSSAVEPNDTMTFTPNGAGYPPLTNITVEVTNSAFDAFSGKTLFAPYSLTFKSAVAAGVLVSITSPTNDASFEPGTGIAIAANASVYGNDTLTNVAFYANATLLTNLAGAPYSFSWANVSAGSYTLTAVASDSLGNSATSSVVNISLGPQVNITSPANNSGFNPGSSIAIAATASETGAAITNVAFYANATLLTNLASAPYSFSWADVPAGSYALTAVASDSLGNSATSSVVNISLGAQINITSPGNNAGFIPGSSIAIAATASETGAAITNVAFYVNATLLTNLSAPYNFTWANVPGGSYALTAVASDTLGNSVTSSVVNIILGPVVARDLESNYSSWTSGQNEGYGFEPWVLAGGGEYNGFILTPSGSIDTAGDSWALYANGTGTPYAYAYRTFSNSLAIGEVFTVQFVNTSVASPGSMGFALRNSTSTTLSGSTSPPPPIVTNSATRFAFYYTGGQSDYTIWDANGAHDSGIPFTTGGLTLQFSPLTANAYQLTVLSADGPAVLSNWSGTLAGTSGSAIQTFTAFNADTGSYQDAYYNTLEIFAAGPVVTIVSPTNNADYATGTGITLSANATDLSGAIITNVAYYANASLVGNATSTPYSYVWAGAPAGSYALTAVAGDELGNSATSPMVNITVVQAAGLPDLSVSYLGNSVIVSWPDTGSYTLLSSSNLMTATSWTTNNYPVTTANGTNSITIAPPTGNLFFRLANP